MAALKVGGVKMEHKQILLSSLTAAEVEKNTTKLE